MSQPFRTSRTLQLVTVAMLVTSVAQLVYWLFDEASFTGSLVAQRVEQFDADREAAQLLLERGADTERVLGLFPALGIQDGRAFVEPEFVAGLVSARSKRLFRYGSEGTFLLLVLVGGIATLSHAMRQPAELMRRQSNFIAAVSHEFKTPLASIKLGCETMLLRELDREGRHKLSQRMLQDTDRLETMVTNILDTSQVSEGRLELRPELLRLESVVDPLFARERARGLAPGVSLNKQFDSGLHVVFDPGALTAVLGNLIANATQAVTLQGQGTVTVKAVRQNREVRIDIVDEGIGFDPKQRNKLFLKFYRPGDELRRESKGTGLGLYIVKSFIEQSGGRVEASSPGPGQGAIFSLWLPGREGVGV